MTSEFALVDKIRSRLPGPADSSQVWIGDDAAVLPIPPGRYLLLAADSVVAGVHADLTLTGADDLGWKAMAASVSDLAAMGADPGYALVTVSAPAGFDFDALYDGLAAASVEFACPIVGGDLTGGDALVVTVAVAGHCDGDPVLRSGARPGDGVWVTGPLGSSAAGLRLLRAGATSDPESAALAREHARPRPRLAEGAAARRGGARAMIDVSDGLAADVRHLADESGVGFELDTVPVAAGATEEEAIGGGEDFQLVFCAPDPARVTEAFATLPSPLRIGTAVERAHGITLRGRELPSSGWEHRW